MASAWDGLLNTPLMTELPSYAYGKNNPSDAYYTHRHVAEYCVEQFKRVCNEQSIDTSAYTFVEPSAGEGCFYDYLPAGEERKIGIDIEPRNERFIREDYLSWYPDKRSEKYIVIGNPPFGHRGAIALAFLNRSLLYADIVAFILPVSFYSNGKGTNMKRVQGGALIHSETLARESFYDPDTRENVAVNTVFQVWRKGDYKSVFTDYDVSEFVDIYTCCSSPKRYCGLGRGRAYDCYIASTFYGEDIGLVYSFEEVKYGSGYGLIIKKDKHHILKLLEDTDWTQFSSVATNSCHHIRMFHIRQLLGQAGFGEAI